MADPNIPVAEGDLRYEDRSGCLVLVDPMMPHGQRDIAIAWPETTRKWRLRMLDASYAGQPYPTAEGMELALRTMLSGYASKKPAVTARLRDQQFRLSCGLPQIFRIDA